MYCLNMLSMALELAVHDPVYEDVATKFFEHFMYIGNAINNLGLWNAEVRAPDGVSGAHRVVGPDASMSRAVQEGFYFDNFHDGQHSRPLKIFSFVGLTPMFAVETIKASTLDKLPNFKRRMEWCVSPSHHHRAR